tara:strand:+ start:75 stop:608 length:534 start_codon:yes stop_codon:yes gene_type:complete
MKYIISLAVLALLSSTNAISLDANVAPKAILPKKKTKDIEFQVGSSKDDKAFAEIDTELDQAKRNVDQGEIGRQLGLTKMVGLKMNFKNLGENIKKEIMGISNLPGSNDDANKKKFDEEYKFLASEGEKLKTYIPKIEKLEKELELLDIEANGKDDELRAIPLEFVKEIEESKKAMV